jgi:hypothetical protein
LRIWLGKLAFSLRLEAKRMITWAMRLFSVHHAAGVSLPVPIEISGSRPGHEAPSRKPYFSRNESSMRKMLLKGRFKVLENHSRFVLLVSSSPTWVSRI